MKIDNDSNTNKNPGIECGHVDDYTEQEKDIGDESESDKDESYSKVASLDFESEGTQYDSEGTQYDSPDCVAPKDHGRPFKLPGHSFGRGRVKDISGETLKFRKDYREGKEITVVDWIEDEDDHEIEAVEEVFLKQVSTPSKYQVKVSRNFEFHQ